MSRPPDRLEERCASALRRHLEAGDESTLHEAYEFGRLALAREVGVLDMALLLWRAVLEVRPGFEGDRRIARRIEEFLLECLSPFEMAHRGAREANEALRTLEERREEHVRRVGRELHDQAGQLLATVYLSLDGLRSHLAPEGEESLARMVALLNQVEDEIRRVAHELRPMILDDLGLVPALRFLGEGVAQRSGLSITVKGSTGGRLPPRIETELYRTAQEALSNVARHSRASKAEIEIRRTQREVRCGIRDDGRGFDPAARPAPGAPRGLGLSSIRERLAPRGGALEVRSRPGDGTELLISIPLEVSHAHTGSAGG
jgi:signal transduction histidine kinase